MKRIFLLLAALALTACEPATESTSSVDCGTMGTGKRDIMECVESGYSYAVWKDTETGCEYFVAKKERAIAVIQLTDRDGRPKVTEE